MTDVPSSREKQPADKLCGKVTVPLLLSGADRRGSGSIWCFADQAPGEQELLEMHLAPIPETSENILVCLFDNLARDYILELAAYSWVGAVHIAKVK